MLDQMASVCREDRERSQILSSSSSREELSDARLATREEVLKIIEKLVLDLLECLHQGRDPEFSLVCPAAAYNIASLFVMDAVFVVKVGQPHGEERSQRCRRTRSSRERKNNKEAVLFSRNGSSEIRKK